MCVCYLVASKGKSFETSGNIVEIILPCPYEFIIESKLHDLSTQIIVNCPGRIILVPIGKTWERFSRINLLLVLQESLPPTSQCIVVMNPNVLDVFNAVCFQVLYG